MRVATGQPYANMLGQREVLGKTFGDRIDAKARGLNNSSHEGKRLQRRMNRLERKKHYSGQWVCDEEHFDEGPRRSKYLTVKRREGARDVQVFRAVIQFDCPVRQTLEGVYSGKVLQEITDGVVEIGKCRCTNTEVGTRRIFTPITLIAKGGNPPREESIPLGMPAKGASWRASSVMQTERGVDSGVRHKESLGSE